MLFLIQQKKENRNFHSIQREHPTRIITAVQVKRTAPVKVLLNHDSYSASLLNVPLIKWTRQNLSPLTSPSDVFSPLRLLFSSTELPLLQQHSFTHFLWQDG